MKESLDFSYDGIYSMDMKVRNVNSSSGLFEEFFLPTRTIHEQKAANREKPYFLEVSHEPLSFPLTLLLDDGVNESDFRKIVQWLCTDYYKPLIFTSNPNRIFYAMLEGESVLKHNGLGQGTIDLTVRCDSPYSYTPEYFEENVLEKTEDVSNKFIVNKDNFLSGKLSGVTLVEESIELVSKNMKWGQIPSNSKWRDVL